MKLLHCLFIQGIGISMGVAEIDVKPAQEPTHKPVIITVCEKALAEKPLKTSPANQMLAQVAGDELEAYSAMNKEEEWVSKLPLKHPFLATAHLAFAGHRPMAISPDMIWLLLSQQVAEEVRKSPEKYREHFAAHEFGKRTLGVSRDNFELGKPGNDWPGVFAELESQILKDVPDSPAASFSHAFSTSTSTEIAARQVVLLAAASPFFEYHVSTLCGIPRIELEGTPDDWRWIRQKVTILQTFNMDRKTKALIPVLDEFIAASEGKANPAFWKSFYKFSSQSGGSYVSGWINLFFVSESDKLLDVVLEPTFTWTAAPIVKTDLGASNLPVALNSKSYKLLGALDTDFVWNYFGKAKPMRIRAGFIGVAQDKKSLTLKPRIAWQVLHMKISREEMEAVDYLSQLQMVIDRSEFRYWGRLAFDEKSQMIKLGEEFREGELGSQFWHKAFPLMIQLKAIDVSKLISEIEDPKEIRAICEAMLSAKSVTQVNVPADLDKACLSILQSRKDWKIETAKAE
ncbi:MAG: DUF4419 domain-containing protein [Verrucomicrobiota bacterium]